MKIHFIFNSENSQILKILILIIESDLNQWFIKNALYKEVYLKI